MKISAKIPNLKRNLERIIFDVKALLRENDCGSAFWIGIFKNC